MEEYKVKMESLMKEFKERKISNKEFHEKRKELHDNLSNNEEYKKLMAERKAKRDEFLATDAGKEMMAKREARRKEMQEKLPKYREALRELSKNKSMSKAEFREEIKKLREQFFK